MNHPHTTGRAYGGVGCTIAVLLAVLLTLFATPGPTRAFAQEPADGVTQPATASAIELRIDELTPVVTDSSGFRVRVTVANHGTAAVEHAHLSVRTNTQYNFVSRSDLQAWADGTAMIPLPDELLSLAVDTVAVDGERTVTGELHADAEQLRALTTWGPRPLALALVGTDGAPLPDAARAQTFLTRSQNGLSGERTPAINLTVAMPLTSHGWEADTTVTGRLLSSSSSATQPADAIRLGADDVRALKDRDDLATRFPHLQLVGDPLVLRAVGTPHVQAISQPAMFDVTTYARVGDTTAYAAAGITDQSWRADTGLNLLRAALGDGDARSRAIAWQGAGSWTMQALDTARAQGYETVVATGDFTLQDDATASTEVYRVPTAHGDVTVLAAQSTLTALAQQRPTSAQASAEQTDAGRLQRFIAQSAFYQMEQPYETRSLLVCLGESAGTGLVSSLMDALGDASWVNLTSLDELAGAEPSIPSDQMADLINQHVGQGMPAVTASLDALSALGRSRDDIERFNESILLTDAQHASASASSSPSASPSAGASSAASGERLSATAWGQYLLQAHDAFALPALGANDATRATMVDGARAFADALLGSITLVPSGSLNVVSESASMPVTVSNHLPYPISVRVSSLTDSMEIVTSRMSDVEVGAKSEAQTSFVVRVSTSGTTVAREQLLDRQDQPFGAAQQTTITSSLQISDKSGIAIIAVAVVLGLLGLWRQFHRKKDPDE